MTLFLKQMFKLNKKKKVASGLKKAAIMQW